MSEQLTRAAESLRAHGLDFVLLSAPPSVTYASGFEAPLLAGYTAELTGWLPTLALVAADGSGCLVLADTEAGPAREQTWLDVSDYEALGHFEPTDPQEGFARALEEALRAAGLAGSPAKLGVEPSLPEAARRVLAGVCPSVELRDATPPLDAARRIKTPRELTLLRDVIALADHGQRRLQELAAAGAPATGAELWADVVGAMQARAGSAVPVVGELVTGPRTAVLGAHGSAAATVARGEPMLLDIGPRLRGYWADCCNTVVHGAEPNPEQRRYLTATREACEAAIDTLRPGRPSSDAPRAIAAALERNGLRLAHYGGHQIGAGANEPPRLLPYDETSIEAGMVFAVEAGAYGGPDAGLGARAEKIALVTESGPEVLSAFPWEA